MPLITDPDSLNQGTSTAVADLRFGTPTGSALTITSAGSNIPALADNEFFIIRGANDTENNGLYVVDDATPATGSLDVIKISDNAPVADATDSTGAIILGTTGAGSETSVGIVTDSRRIYLPEQGNLDADGVTLQALYSFLKEEWKADSALIALPFPLVAITPEQFEFIEGWQPADATVATATDIRSRKVIRTGGWSEISGTDVLTSQYAGVISLGSFEDEANDLAYYAFGTDATVNNAQNFTFAGPLNEAVKTYEDIGNVDTLTFVDGGGGDDSITRATGSFITDGFVVGGRVVVRSATASANDGTYIVTAVAATTLSVATASFTTPGADAAAQLAVDNRNVFKVYLRVRDGDPFGKLYDSSDLVAIGLSELTNKAERFPLANATDLKIAETDANISSTTPYTEIEIKYLDQAYNREVDSVTKRNFGIVIDVGTYSEANGAAATTSRWDSASYDGGLTLSDYTGGTLIVHEGTNQGSYTISGTPVDSAGTLQITVVGTPLTATGTNESFTMQRASPVVASIEEIYEKVQYQLRQTTDIDFGGTTVIGATADELLTFVGDALTVGNASSPPSNPNGGGTGVIIEGFDSNDTNDLTFVDNTGTSRTFPFVAAGTINFNSNLVNDTGPAEYYMYFTYTTRTNSTTAAMTAVSGSAGTITGTADLPTLTNGDYINVTGFPDAENNGIFQVTGSPTTSSVDVIRVDGGTLVADAGPQTIDVDQNPINSPDAILVDNNSGADITGNVPGASVAFDFDYDNNVQGGRTAATDAAVTIRAIGLDLAQFVETTGTITRATGLSFSLVAALERNYENP
jgi:hypothetical protein